MKLKQQICILLFTLFLLLQSIGANKKKWDEEDNESTTTKSRNGAGGGLIGSIFGMNPFRPASGGSSQPSSSGQSPSSSPTGRKSEPVSCGTRYNEMQSTRRRRDLDASGWLKKEELNEIQAKLNLMLQELERAMGRMNTQTFVQNANATGFFDFGHRHASKLLEGFRKFKRSAEMVERPVRSNDWFGRGNDRTYKNFTLHCSYGKSGDSKTRQNATRFMGSMMDEEPRDNGSGDGEPRKAVEQESRRSSGNAKTTTRRPPVRPNPLKNATLIVIKESRPMHRNGHLPSSNQTSAMSESLRKSILDEIRREFGLKASPINQAVRQSVQINCGGHREGCKSRSHRRLYKSSNQVKPGNNNNALNKRKRFPSNNGNRVEDSGNASNGISGPSGNHSNGHQNNDFNNQPNFDSEYDFSEHPHSGNGANPHSGKRSNEIYRPGRETKNQHSETRADNFSHENSSDSSDEGDHDSNTSEDSNKKDNRRRNPREIMRDINRMYHRFKRAVSTTSQPDGTKTTLPTIQNDARIVGGTQAVPDMYPWLVSIQKENAGHFCGGTIIHEQWIVTAAHCFGSEISFTKYMVGHGSLNWYNAKLRPVEKVITHEKFDSETMRNDIALLKLKQPFAFRKGSTDHPSIVPVCLNDQPANKKLSAEVAGWGKVLQDASKPSDKLMYIKIDQLDDKSCSKYKTYNPALMMCAGTIEGTKDSCQGDSGGPLMTQNPSNKKFYQIGLVSFGAGCGQKGAPGVYTKLSQYMPWIKDKTGIDSFER